MPRSARQQPSGVVFHALNRGNERRELFEDAADYDAFVRVLAEAVRAAPIDWLVGDAHLTAFARRDVAGAV